MRIHPIRLAAIVLAGLMACTQEQGGTDPDTVDHVQVAPAALELTVGQQQPLGATAFSGSGAVLTGGAVTWQSGNPSVAAVSPGGMVSAIGAGNTSVTATIGGKSGQAAVHVSLPPQSLSITTAGTGQGTVTSAPGTVNCVRGSGAQTGTCAGEYPAGTVVTLTAIAAVGGHSFTGWSGEGCNGTGACQVTLSQARSVTATFTAPNLLAVTTAGTGSGSITSNPAGINCSRIAGTESGACSAPVAVGTDVTLSAAPGAGHTFAGWTGEGCSGTGACQVNLGQARSVTATFTAPQLLTVTTTGSGNGSVTSNPAGIACARAGGVQSGSCSTGFPLGTIVTLTAQAAAGQSFLGWSGEGCGGTGTCQVTMNQAGAVTAAFSQAQQLGVTLGGTGNGSVTSAPSGISCSSAAGFTTGTCSAGYVAGTVVTLTAQGAAGHNFEGWTGESCAGTGSCQVTMSQARTVTATFLPPLTLTVTTTGGGGGTVTSNPAGISCTRAGGVESGTCTTQMPAGAVVSLSAAPAGGDSFTEWGGFGCSGSGACQVTMNQAQGVTAVFALRQVQLTITTQGTGSGTVLSAPDGIDCSRGAGQQSGTCSKSVDAGTVVSLWAQVAEGHQFTGWGGGGCSGTGTCQVNMDQARAVTASFTEQVEPLTVITAGNGNGTVTSTPAGISCTRAGGAQSGACLIQVAGYGVVSLTAQPAAGQSFAGWSGGGCSGTGSCQVTMTEARQVTATFTRPPLQLTVITGGAGSGVVTSAPAGINCNRTNDLQTGNCAALIDWPTTVTLTATPSGVFRFGGWSGEGCSGTDPCQVSMTQARWVTATFEIPLGFGTGTDLGFGDEQFASIPAGQFLMGAPTGGGNAAPAHTVILTHPFRMLKTEVTISQWLRVNGGDPATVPIGSRFLPVTGVTWDMIQNWLVLLNQQDPGKGYRLPTEAEWEYAARAGNTADKPANLDAFAWTAANNGLAIKPVATRQANPWGLYDMIGNAVELVQDVYGLYSAGSVTDPVGPAGPGLRVYRGNQYDLTSPPALHTYWTRWWMAQDVSTEAVGFRIVAAGSGSYPLTVTTLGTGSGRVTSDPAGIDCVQSSGGQSGSCSVNGGAGSAIILTAIPGPGFGQFFTGWSGACSGTGNCVVAMNQAKNVTARFEGQFALTVTTVGDQARTITSTPAGISCHNVPISSSTGTCQALFDPGTIVAMTAVPANNGQSFFIGWGGGCSGTAACQVTMSQARSVVGTFAFVAGSLNVAITGLPAGAIANVTATGPGGGSFAVPSSQAIPNAASGSWTITAGQVTVGTNLYAPTPSSQTVNVAAGGSASALVTYALVPPPSLNLRVGAAYLTQAIQQTNHSAQLVAGRDGYFRIFVVANEANSAQPQVRVRVFNGASEVLTTILNATSPSVPLTVNEGGFTTSWNIKIPAALIVPGLSLQAEVDPGGLIREQSETDNTFPGTGQVLNMSVRTLPPFNVRLFPILQSVNGLQGDLNAGNSAGYLATLLALMPIGAYSADIRAPYTTNAPALESNNGNGAWGTVLSEVLALRNSTDQSSRYYYGVVKTSYNGGVAGLGYVPSSPGQSNQAAIGWDVASSRARTLAHELGHNFGRMHAPCGNVANPDPNFPYPGGGIGAWGFNVATLESKDPSGYFDLMGYCAPYAWTSPYTWNAVVNWRAASPVGAPPAGAAAGPDDGLLVWGRITPRGTVVEPAFRVAPTGAPLPARGSWRVEGRDGAGGLVFSQPFEPELVADLPGGDERHFAMVLPLGAATLDRIASLRVVGPGGAAERRAGSGTAAPGGDPVARGIGTGRQRLTWDGARYPMAMVRDPATGEILSFARGGSIELWSRSAGLEVQLSDGVRVVRRRIAVQ